MTTAAAGFLTAVALSAPFGLSVVSFTGTAPFIDSSLLRLVFKTAADYPYLSVNAYNMWALFPVDGQDDGDQRELDPRRARHGRHGWGAIGPIPRPALVGAVLLLIGIAVLVSLVVVARRPDRLTILVGTASGAGVLRPPHARPRALPVPAVRPRRDPGRVLVALADRVRGRRVATFLNMYVVLTTIYPDNPSISDWLGIGDAIRSFWGVALIALVNTGVLAWASCSCGPAPPGRSPRSRAGCERSSRRRRRPGIRPADDEPAPHGPASPPGPAPRAAAAAVPIARRPAARRRRAAGPPATPRLVPAWYDRPSWGELGSVGAGCAPGSARRRSDPTAPRELNRERGGRLDRLDLWVVIVLVVAAMCLRTYRLAEPARMHFDEVYHARTATEFLQDWRYGISHDIYEWTHPHLAKYAMAMSIDAFAGHDVAARRATSGCRSGPRPSSRAAPTPPRPTARDGDRVWVVTGTEVIAYDLETRKVEARWSMPGASTVTYDSTGNQVFVGTDAGAVLSIDTTTLDVARQGQGASPADLGAVGTLAGAPVQLVAWDQGSGWPRLADGTVAVIDASTGDTVGTLVARGRDRHDADRGDGDAVVATPADVTDPAAVGEGAGRRSRRRRRGLRGGPRRRPTRTAWSWTSRSPRSCAPPAGRHRPPARLPGIAIAKTQLLAVADAAGIDLVTDRGLVADRVALAGGAPGLALVTGLDVRQPALRDHRRTPPPATRRWP